MSYIHYIISYFFVYYGVWGWGPFHQISICCEVAFSRKEPQLLFHVTSPTWYSKYSKMQKWNVQKMIMNRDIGILHFTFVVMWKQNVHFILLSIAHNVTNLKFLLWHSFSHLSWFEIPHILGVWDIIYISGTYQIDKL